MGTRRRHTSLSEYFKTGIPTPNAPKSQGRRTVHPHDSDHAALVSLRDTQTAYTSSDANGTGYYLAQSDQSGSFPIGQCRSFDLPKGHIEGAIVVGEYGGNMSNTQHVFNGAGVNFTVWIHGSNQDSYPDMHTKSIKEGSIGTVDTLNYVASTPNTSNAFNASITSTPGHPTWESMEAKFINAGCVSATGCTNSFANLGEPSVTDSMKAYVNTTTRYFETKIFEYVPL